MQHTGATVRPRGCKTYGSHKRKPGKPQAIIYLSSLSDGLRGGETVFPVALDPNHEGLKLPIFGLS